MHVHVNLYMHVHETIHACNQYIDKTETKA